jgi:uncharacterized protein
MRAIVDDLIVRVPDGLIQGDIDGHPYLFNPRGHYGVVPLSQEAYAVYTSCSKGVSISDMRRLFPWAKEATWQLIDLLTSLATYGILDLGKEFSEYLIAQRTKTKKREMSVWLQITDSCNLRCSYCFIAQKPTHMHIETAKTLIAKIAKESYDAGYDSVVFKFAGGEPTIRWGTIKELIDWAQASLHAGPPHVRFSMLTNGTMLPPDLVEYAASGRIGISISLDGIEQWHDKQRFYHCGRGSFRDIDQNIDLLLRRGVRPSLSATITSENVKGLTELAEYCVHRDLRFRLSPYRRPLLSLADQKSENAELIYELKRCYEWLEDHLPSRSLYEVHQFGDISLKTPKVRVCGIGTNTLVFSSDGRLSLCPFDLENPVGNGLENNAIELLRSQKAFSPDDNRVDLIPVCQDCQWRFTCAGGCPNLTRNQYGVFHHTSPYCEVYQAILPVLVRLYAVQLLRAGYPLRHRDLTPDSVQFGV